MIRRIGVVVVLVGVWVALWGELTVANVASGVAVAAATLALVPLERPEVAGRLRPWPAARFGGYFARQLLVANAEVAWEVVTPGNRDNEGIIAVRYPASCTPTVLMVIVNAIGLTPGTIVVDIDDASSTLFVHVLHLDDAEESRADLLELERRAIEAFGAPSTRAEMAELLAEGGHRTTGEAV